MSKETIKSIQISQETDTPLASIDNRVFSTRYVSYQSRESRSNDQPSQDYLSIKTTDRKLVFAICDGVGSSFVGNIASKFLGDKLVEYLWNFDTVFQEYWFGSEAKIKDTVTKSMRAWVDEAQSYVRNYIFPTGIPELHKKGLEALRDEHGSEAVFSAGIIDFDGSNYSIIIFNAGDIEYRLYDRNNLLISSNEMLKNSSNRWSTRWGLKGEVNLKRLPPNKEFARLLVFTDGIIGHEADIDSLDSPNINNIIEDSIERNNDDVSIIEIKLKVNSLEHTENNFAISKPNTANNNQSFPSPSITKAVNSAENLRIHLNENLLPPEIEKIDLEDRFEETNIVITLKPTKPKRYEFCVSPSLENTNYSKKFSVMSGSHQIKLSYSGKYSIKGIFYIKGRAIHGNQIGEWSEPTPKTLWYQRLNPTIISFKEEGEVTVTWRDYIESSHYEFDSGEFWSKRKILKQPPYETTSSKARIRATLNDGTTTNWEEVMFPITKNYFSTIEDSFIKINKLGKTLGVKYPIFIRIGFFKDNSSWKELGSLKINYSESGLTKNAYELEKQINNILSQDKTKPITFICYDWFEREYRLIFTPPSQGASRHG